MARGLRAGTRLAVAIQLLGCESYDSVAASRKDSIILEQSKDESAKERTPGDANSIFLRFGRLWPTLGDNLESFAKILARGVDGGVLHRLFPFKETSETFDVIVLPLDANTESWPESLVSYLKNQNPPRAFCSGSEWIEFGRMPQFARCGGILMTNRIVVTAAHCISDCEEGVDRCETSHELFLRYDADLGSSPSGTGRLRRASICAQKQQGDDEDWAILLLDRAAASGTAFLDGVRVLGSEPAREELVVTYQHPMGLPLKRSLGLVTDGPGKSFLVKTSYLNGSSGGVVLSRDGTRFYGVIGGSSHGVAFAHNDGCLEPVYCDDSCTKPLVTPVSSFESELSTCIEIAEERERLVGVEDDDSEGN